MRQVEACNTAVFASDDEELVGDRGGDDGVRDGFRDDLEGLGRLRRGERRVRNVEHAHLGGVRAHLGRLITFSCSSVQTSGAGDGGGGAVGQPTAHRLRLKVPRIDSAVVSAHHVISTHADVLGHKREHFRIHHRADRVAELDCVHVCVDGGGGGGGGGILGGQRRQLVVTISSFAALFVVSRGVLGASSGAGRVGSTGIGVAAALADHHRAQIATCGEKFQVGDVLRVSLEGHQVPKHHVHIFGSVVPGVGEHHGV
mmetsp:Transcript_38406/g.66284  ORF Transcript_38406/g.66284 Transcript_38406/m.66284 type:complete len:257 (+) Transcript_38406:1043-1813(+)